jgi:hypothetical protein
MNNETKNTTTTLPFILVSDKTIINILKQNGYVCVNETETVCTFMNNGKLTFSDSIDNKKIVYSNKLCF